MGGILLAACTRTGDVTGDVYITMKSGDVKRGADVEVFLVSPTSEFEKDWADAQAAFGKELRTARSGATAAANDQAARAKESYAASDEFLKSARSGNYRGGLNQFNAASDRHLAAIDNAAKADGAVVRTVAQHQISGINLIQKHQVALVRTDVNGHYVTQQLPTGKYYIFAAHRIFDNMLFWFQPIEVRRGQTTWLDLTGSNSGWPFDPSLPI